MSYDLLTVTEVAAELRVTSYTVREYLKTGDLRGVKVGNRWRVPREALEEFLAAPPKPSTPKPRPVTGRMMRHVRGLA